MHSLLHDIPRFLILFLEELFLIFNQMSSIRALSRRVSEDFFFKMRNTIYVKQSGSRLGSTFCGSSSGCKLFAKAINGAVFSVSTLLAKLQILKSTVNLLKFQTLVPCQNKPGQTVQIQIRLLLKSPVYYSTKYFANPSLDYQHFI